MIISTISEIHNLCLKYIDNHCKKVLKVKVNTSHINVKSFRSISYTLNSIKIFLCEDSWHTKFQNCHYDKPTELCKYKKVRSMHLQFIMNLKHHQKLIQCNGKIKHSNAYSRKSGEVGME